jgi:hypothetical protein
MALVLGRGALFLASHPNWLEPVYVGFRSRRTTILFNSAQLSKFAISCRE